MDRNRVSRDSSHLKLPPHSLVKARRHARSSKFCVIKYYPTISRILARAFLVKHVFLRGAVPFRFQRSNPGGPIGKNAFPGNLSKAALVPRALLLNCAWCLAGLRLSFRFRGFYVHLSPSHSSGRWWLRADFGSRSRAWSSQVCIRVLRSGALFGQIQIGSRRTGVSLGRFGGSNRRRSSNGLRLPRCDAA